VGTWKVGNVEEPGKRISKAKNWIASNEFIENSIVIKDNSPEWVWNNCSLSNLI
jgi:hypothetical protein